jgi:hypothetical protein
MLESTDGQGILQTSWHIGRRVLIRGGRVFCLLRESCRTPPQCRDYLTALKSRDRIDLIGRDVQVLCNVCRGKEAVGDIVFHHLHSRPAASISLWMSDTFHAAMSELGFTEGGYRPDFMPA